MITGYFKHFKGGIYRVICEAVHSETQEEMVVYQNLPSKKIWVRPKRMFLDKVFRDGKYYPRFTPIDEVEALKIVELIIKNL